MKKSINPVTKLQQVDFEGKLIWLSDEERELKNDKKTKYFGCTIEFKNAQGEIQRTGAVMYGKNKAYGVTPGKVYACRATLIPGNERPFITVSHLENLPLDDIKGDAFGFEALSENDVKEAATKVS